MRFAKTYAAALWIFVFFGLRLETYGFTVSNNAGVAVNGDASQVTLSVTVSGSGLFNYQWYKGLSGNTSNPLDGATSSSLAVNQTMEAANYWVRVSSAGDYVDSASFPLGKWRLIDPLFGSVKLTAVTYGAGKYAAVGTGAGYSADSVNWKVGTIESGANLGAVLFDGARFVAAGGGGQVFTSDDGIAWQKRRPADTGVLASNTVRGAAYGNGVTVFAAGPLLSSTDGSNWQWRSTSIDGQTMNIRSVSFGAGRFVAVGGRISSRVFINPLTALAGLPAISRSFPRTILIPSGICFRSFSSGATL
jgi:hypothetical protein